MSKGTIILLNGASSSGKAAISHFLQEILSEPFVRISVDEQLHHVPERLMSSEYEALSEEASLEMMELLPKLISAIHQSLAVYAQSGVNLIVEHVIQRQEWLDECLRVLEGYPVLFVGVHCGLETLQSRAEAAEVVQGLAEVQMDVVHLHGAYDVEVDTCSATPLENAEVIKRALEGGEISDAFEELRNASKHP